MTEKPEILFLAHRIPYPPDKGDKIRSWRLLSHLAERFHVHLGCFVDDPADMAHAEFLQGMTESAAFVPLDPLQARMRSLKALLSGGPLSLAWYDDARMRAFVKRVRARNLAAEIVFSSSMAPYVEAPHASRPRLVDLCDADSEKWRDYAVTARGALKAVYGLEARRLAAAETAIINWADVSLAVSRAEADILGGREGVKKPVACFGNGVDADYFSPHADFGEPAETFDVVFVGAMDYRANVEAALWFVRHVWPIVRESAPKARFGIIGARPARAIRSLDGRRGVAVTGRVADVRPFLRGARAVVAPLSVARGVQNKVLEAMAMARPVVATPGAQRGIDGLAGVELIVADEPHDFAAAVAALLGEPDRGERVGAAARARVLKDFTWAAKLAELDAALRKAGVG